MWKSLKSAFAFLALYLVSIPAFGTPSGHQDLKLKFPYGLLSDDYGILTKNDLAINACHFKPKPFPPEPFINPYEYWQCFDTKAISMECEKGGIIQDSPEGPMGLLVVRAASQQIKHDYIERRPWPIRECRSSLKDMAALLRGAQHACISGSFIENETDSSGHKITSWLFDRLKTHKGCEGRDCEFTDKIRQEYCPDLKS